ncbi:MAG: hypothetical protein B6D40_12315 [Anaerolineae bacterium UTCFX3]|nr:MAG: hypothetical protein B6D40_12315 [Anaerolineae bacterium UTCFX3]
MTQPKPLHWTPAPDVGLSVVRRGDGGMTLTFTDLSEATVKAWHEFALEHLLGADRRTRNLYDLRAVKEIPEKAIRKAADAIRTVAALALPETAAAMKIFTDINAAEAWLGRPLDQIP